MDAELSVRGCLAALSAGVGGDLAFLLSTGAGVNSAAPALICEGPNNDGDTGGIASLDRSNEAWVLWVDDEFWKDIIVVLFIVVPEYPDAGELVLLVTGVLVWGSLFD